MSTRKFTQATGGDAVRRFPDIRGAVSGQRDRTGFQSGGSDRIESMVQSLPSADGVYLLRMVLEKIGADTGHARLENPHRYGIGKQPGLGRQLPEIAVCAVVDTLLWTRLPVAIVHTLYLA